MADQPDNSPAGDDSRDYFIMLVVRYFDDDLDAAELSEMNTLLRNSPEHRREFALYSRRVSLLRESVDREQHEVDFIPMPAHRSGSKTLRTQPGRWRRRVFTFAGAACLAAVAVTLIIRFWPSIPVPEAPLAAVVGAVEPLSGDVHITDGNGTIRVINARTEIRVGDTVHTEGAQAAAALVYPDATRLTLVGDTSITCSSDVQKTVQLHLGTVAASVNPQPDGRPMLLITPRAKIEVRGTEFNCQAFRDRTDVRVIKGSVLVTRTSDGKTVEVRDNKRVLANGGADLTVEDVTALSDTWNLDFEQGMPAEMTRGRFVTEGLPRGSKGGVAAIAATDAELEGHFEIATPQLWNEGFFAIHPDTHLHFTYKMDRPDWINVFIGVRGPDPSGPFIGNYLIRDAQLYAPPRPGKWQTVSVPLATLRRAGIASDRPPAVTDVPFHVLFSSLGDRGLVIDQIWATRGGPGVVQLKDVD